MILHVNHEKKIDHKKKERTADGLTRQKKKERRQNRNKVKKLHLDKLLILEFHEKKKKYIAMQWENE